MQKYTLKTFKAAFLLVWIRFVLTLLHFNMPYINMQMLKVSCPAYYKIKNNEFNNTSIKNLPNNLQLFWMYIYKLFKTKNPKNVSNKPFFKPLWSPYFYFNRAYIWKYKVIQTNYNFILLIFFFFTFQFLND